MNEMSIFTEWTVGAYAKTAELYHLKVKFENSNGVEKEVSVLPQTSNPEKFSAVLFEGDFIVGELTLAFDVNAVDTLGNYTLTVLKSDAAQKHYATNEYPIMIDKDFQNFVVGFHAAIKNWKELQQAKEL